MLRIRESVNSYLFYQASLENDLISFLENPKSPPISEETRRRLKSMPKTLYDRLPLALTDEKRAAEDFKTLQASIPVNDVPAAREDLLRACRMTNESYAELFGQPSAVALPLPTAVSPADVTTQHADAASNQANRDSTIAVSPAAEAIERANLAAQKRDWDKAIADCTEAIQLDPKLAMAYNMRGLAYDQKHEWDNAIADCSEAIRLDPKYAAAYSAYFGRAGAYAHKGEWDKVIADCSEAIRLNPKLAMAYGMRGHAYVEQGEWDKVIADCTEAIRLNPEVDISLPGPQQGDLARTYSARGIAYAHKGESEKAIADCTEAIRLKPRCAEAYYGRGVAYQAKGDIEKARADFDQAKTLGYKP
jgi:tetratricopeptide (TPR) repeat protein